MSARGGKSWRKEREKKKNNLHSSDEEKSDCTDTSIATAIEGFESGEQLEIESSSILMTENENVTCSPKSANDNVEDSNVAGNTSFGVIAGAALSDSHFTTHVLSKPDVDIEKPADQTIDGDDTALHLTHGDDSLAVGAEESPTICVQAVSDNITDIKIHESDAFTYQMNTEAIVHDGIELAASSVDAQSVMPANESVINELQQGMQCLSLEASGNLSVQLPEVVSEVTGLVIEEDAVEADYIQAGLESAAEDTAGPKLAPVEADVPSAEAAQTPNYQATEEPTDNNQVTLEHAVSIRTASEQGDNFRAPPETVDYILAPKEKVDSIRFPREQGDSLQAAAEEAANPAPSELAIQILSEHAEDITELPEVVHDAQAPPEKTSDIQVPPEQAEDIEAQQEEAVHIQASQERADNIQAQPGHADNIQTTPEQADDTQSLSERADAIQVSTELSEQQRTCESQESTKADEVFLQEYITTTLDRLQRKAKLRATNTLVAKERPELNTAKLDSSLKKNTAFIKKLRQYTDSQYELLSKELITLNLTRYIEEVANAILEARLKMSDIGNCVLLCSQLHAKYADFAPTLLAGCTKLLKERSDEKTSNFSKFRVDLRFYAELISAGIFSQKEGLPLLGNVLTHLVNSDKKEHRNAAVIICFCKFCGEDFLGLVSSQVLRIAKTLNMEASLPRSDFLPKERQKNVRLLINDYYNSMSQHLLQQHKLIQREERYNRRLLETRGEVDDARLTALATEQANFDRLLQQSNALAELLCLPPPVIPVEQESTEGVVIVGDATSTVDLPDASQIWEDEDTKAFYTTIPELKALLPSILYKDSEKSCSQEGETDENKVSKSQENMEDFEQIDDEEGTEYDAELMAEREEEEDKQSEEYDSGNSKQNSQKLLFQAFLNSLPNCISRDLMDSAALEFCLNYNTKSFRLRLSRALFLVPRLRQDLLPFYARLVATLRPLMPDLADDLVNRLRAEFKYKVKKKDQICIEGKLKICRFLGELTKFGVVAANDLFICLRMLLADFRHHHIEMACCIFETSGRFLFRTAATHHRTKAILDEMLRKKTVLSFEPRYATMIENAYYYVNPPERRELEEVVALPPTLQFIKLLIVERLSKPTVEKVLRLLRKLDWSDKEVCDHCILRLTAAWDVKFHNIRSLASLVSGLVFYHEWVGPAVVDGVLEDIRVGLETNSPQLNQRRIAMAKYLAELYNYKVIESNVIFKMLYSLITFGAGLDASVSERLDPPEHLIRVRLVVTILESCGVFFSAGNSKRKLDCFITYFQYYYQLKRSQWNSSNLFPVEYDQQVQSCLKELRPGILLYENVDDALAAVTALNEQLIARAVTNNPELKKFLPKNNKSLGTIDESEENADSDSCAITQPRPIPGLIELDDDLDEEEDGRDDEEVAGKRRGGGGVDDDASPEEDEDDDEDESEESDENSSDSSESEEDSSTQDDHTQNEVELERVACPEDDEFISEFEKLVSDSLLEHSRERLGSIPVQLPLANKIISKKTYEQIVEEGREGDNSSPGTVKFVVMTRGGSSNVSVTGTSSGGKQGTSLATISVPEDNEMVIKMRERVRHQAEERQSVKRVTLQMTERLEEEEALQQLLAQKAAALLYQKERRPRFQHPKGTPDADLIFGNKNRP